MSAVRDLLLAVANTIPAIESIPVVNLPDSMWADTLAGSAQRVEPEDTPTGEPSPVVIDPPAAPVVIDASRPLWREAVDHYKRNYSHKLSFPQECVWLDEFDPFLGDKYLDDICDEHLRPFVQAQREKPIYRGTKLLKVGVKSKTINLKLALIRHICIEASRKWRRNGKPWLATPPHISMVEGGDERPPRPLTWEEQEAHLSKLPEHLYRMALFDLNCGVREEVLCNLQWAWERKIDELGITVFVVPPEHVKGRKGKKSARVLVVNSVAQQILEQCRGEHETHVFTYKHRNGVRRPMRVCNNTAWQRFRERCGLGDLHVHDLRHTVGMRLREAGVREETISAVLWHTTASMTQHYSQASVKEVYDALELITAPRFATNRTLQSLMRETA